VRVGDSHTCSQVQAHRRASQLRLRQRKGRPTVACVRRPRRASARHEMAGRSIKRGVGAAPGPRTACGCGKGAAARQPCQTAACPPLAAANIAASGPSCTCPQGRFASQARAQRRQQGREGRAEPADTRDDSLSHPFPVDSHPAHPAKIQKNKQTHSLSCQLTTATLVHDTYAPPFTFLTS